LSFASAYLGGKDRVDSLPFTPQPEGIDFQFFSFMVERKKPKEALQLRTDHFQKRIPLSAILSFLDGITKNIIGFFVHDFYFISFTPTSSMI
jgi:hypothetical protein